MKGLTVFGRATLIADGDGFTLDVGPEKIKCRLAWLDAPEINQRYGPESRATLYHLIHAQMLRVVIFATDKYARRIVSVYNFHEEHVNFEMIWLGAAWYQPRYGTGPPRMAEADRHARAFRQGLWALTNPTDPADHRRQAAAMLGYKRVLKTRRSKHA